MGKRKLLDMGLVLSAALMVLAAPQSALAWRYNINCENGVLGTAVERGDPNSTFTDAAAATYYSNFSPVEGAGSCEMNIEKGWGGFGKWGGRKVFETPLVKGDEVWIRVHLYYPVGFDYTANPYFKVMRVHTSSPTGGNEGYNDLYMSPYNTIGVNPSGQRQHSAYHVIKENQDLIQRVWGDITEWPVMGQWETYEMYLKLDNVSVDNGGAGRIRFWKNGVLKGDFTGITTLSTVVSKADAFLLFTYWNGGNSTGTGAYPTKTQKMYFDDLIIQNDPPAAFDAQGNRMIGTGTGGVVVLPSAAAPGMPTGIRIQ